MSNQHYGGQPSLPPALPITPLVETHPEPEPSLCSQLRSPSGRRRGIGPAAVTREPTNLVVPHVQEQQRSFIAAAVLCQAGAHEVILKAENPGPPGAENGNLN